MWVGIYELKANDVVRFRAMRHENNFRLRQKKVVGVGSCGELNLRIRLSQIRLKHDRHRNVRGGHSNGELVRRKKKSQAKTPHGGFSSSSNVCAPLHSI